jgi:hypothetical protein
MLIKRIVTAAAAAFSLSLLANAAMAEPVSASNAGGSAADQQAPVSNNDPFVLVRGGHGGGHGGGGHMSSRGFSTRGPTANFARRGTFRDRDGRFRHRRFRRGSIVFDGDYGYDGYDGSSCYWNCRQSHGPRYCRAYAANYCY